MKYDLYEVKVLMFLRNNKGEYLFLMNDHEDSIIKGYVNPPGGHIEPGEGFQETVKREVLEEMSVKNLVNIQLKGTINVTGFKENPIMMFIVTADVPESEKPVTQNEGTPVWVDLNDTAKYKMFEDVKLIAGAISKTQKGTFSGKSTFKDKKFVSFEVAGDK
ncbi:NUDIX domain-containing protein [Candidatus Dojkabacteria bacterium]|nr:NUDIX domain-containing protein [Candidatus Dojkabacteria bacterium]